MVSFLFALSFALPAFAESHVDASAPAPAASAAEDPYLWLEDVGGDKSLEWVRARNATSEGELAKATGFGTLEGRLLSILDSDAKIPYVGKMGKYYYNFWKDGQHRRGIWRRTSWAEYQKPEPAWEVVLDLDALGATEKESWVWGGASCLAPSYQRCLVSLSRGGADAVVVREFDTKAMAFVAGGFTLPEAKTDVSWIDLDTVWVGTDFGPGSMTTSGYPREVRRWKRGAALATAEKVYAGEESDVSVSGWHEDTKGFERDWVDQSPTFWTSKRFLVRDGALTKLDKPDDAIARTFREWLYLELRSDWTTGDRTWKAGSLLAIRLDAFLTGSRGFDLLFEPGPRTSLAGYSPTRHHVVVQVLDNVRSRVDVLTPGKTGWTHEPLAGLPDLGTVNVSAVDPEKTDEVFVTVTNYVTPTTLSWARIGKGAPTPLKQLPAYFDAAGLVVSQHEATSKDGTKVPYFQVSKGDLALDGDNPTLLYGYGGFEVSLVPGYSGSVGAAWLEPGGVYVVANIRGGGEFGPSWHQAALKANRNKAYEDFAAVAGDLVARKVTDKDHLGIQGGSNGGLLMGNMLTTYPELFEAVVCQVPLLDMRRYNQLLAGASWMGEYGNPDIPEEWAFIEQYSPYHNLRADGAYPRVLFTTSTRDDRVHPGHARKMAARMLEQGHDLLYYENIEGGHGGAADNKQAAHMWALSYTFLWNELQ
ncbi:MAG: prolyl oligopeptidase family serine peptidase [Pseudomonadota bacterium]|nr:prolyl oligopeptidase family serine peptidase [Pseudomonadota bacterium]